MRRQHKVGILSRHYVDNKRLHVAIRFRLRQRMIFHVLAGMNRIIRETNRIFSFFLTAYHRTDFILVVKESTQTHSQHARNLN